MKFAKYLQEEVVPEWRKAYINYKQGKKYLKAIESAIENKSVSLTIDPELPSGILEGPIAQEPESEYPERPVSTYSSNNVADSPTGATPIMKQSRGSVRSYDTIQIPPYSAYSAASGATSAPGNVQSDNNSSTVLTSDHLQPRKSLRGSLDRRDSIAQQFGEAARAHSSQLFKDLTNRFTSISSPGHESRSRGIQVEGNSLDSVMDQLLDEEKQFFKFLDAQLELVDKFYRGKEVEAETKLKVLKQQLFVADEWRRRYDNKVAKAQAHKAWYQNEWSRVRNGIGSFMVDPSAIHDVTLGPASRVNTESAGSLAVGLSTGTGVNADQQLRQRENRGLVDGCGTKRPLPRQMAYQDQLVLDDEENRRQRLNHSVARTRIKTALCEFYRSLEMLKNYKVLNNTGFVKIMKKFDKTAGWKASKAFIASKLRPAYFMSSTILDDLLEETENLFIEKFENGHRRRALPAWLRFLQCLRRFRDTLEWFPHLLNAGKYLSSLAQIFIYFTYRYYASTPLKVAYIIISIFTSAYTYTWDVYMDWGLFRFGKHGGGAYGHPFLRPELVYPKTWVYYLAIVLDFFGRFVWILRLVPMGLNVRWMWNFFRLENEHLNNCGQFRAIKDIPLPFHIRVEDESDESDEDGDGDGVAGERQGDAVKPGASKSSQGDQMEVVSEGSKPGLSEPAAATTASLHKQSLVRTTSASGSMANRLGSGGPASASQISIRSISSSRASNRPSLKNRPSQSSMAPYGLQRSNTFVDNAMTEAGIGEDRKEQVAAANKFYDRRDFDTKIIDCATEGLFRIRRRSTTTVPHTIGLGTDVQGASTDPDGLMESTSRSRRTIKNSIFGRKSHTDEDDTDEDDEV
ncbi:hypothetical protein BGX27_000812 [Mortierella sp. AM989]|nr:hypothetical protein BGX27_000812 [Mortierella sp. AM989]